MRPECSATRCFEDWWKTHKLGQEMKCIHITDWWNFAHFCVFRRLKSVTRYVNLSFLFHQSRGNVHWSCSAHSLSAVYRWTNKQRKDRKLFAPPKKADPISKPSADKVKAFAILTGCRPVALRSLEKTAYYGEEYLTCRVTDDKIKERAPRNIRLPCSCGVGRGFACFVHRTSAPRVEEFALTTSYAFRRTHTACVIEAMFDRTSIFAEELEKRRWTAANDKFRLRINRQLGWSDRSDTFFEYCSDIKKKGQFNLDRNLVAAIAKLYF